MRIFDLIKQYGEICLEIARYNTLPVNFSGFAGTSGLGDGFVKLSCTDRRPADPFKGLVPSYMFDIVAGGFKVGIISLRVGYSKSLYYTGQIGYAVDAPHRGKGYAGAACRLLAPLMRAHGMAKALITNNPENTASRRVCEKLGAKFIRTVKLPRTHELYAAGDRYKNIFEWTPE